MSTQEEVVLYDLENASDGTCWTPNVWKTRLALNHKGIPYRTVFVPHHLVHDTIKPLTSAPNKTGTEYTVPMIRYKGTYTMDSAVIAPLLESAFPGTPSLHLDDPALPAVASTVEEVFGALFPVWAPLIRDSKILSDASRAWVIEDRTKKAGGKDLDEVYREAGAGTDLPWDKARPGMQALVDVLKRDESGPFVRGKEWSYADAHIVAQSRFYEMLQSGDNGSLFKRWIGFDPVLERHLEACRPWLKRDDK